MANSDDPRVLAAEILRLSEEDWVGNRLQAKALTKQLYALEPALDRHYGTFGKLTLLYLKDYLNGQI